MCIVKIIQLSESLRNEFINPVADVVRGNHIVPLFI